MSDREVTTAHMRHLCSRVVPLTSSPLAAFAVRATTLPSPRTSGTPRLAVVGAESAVVGRCTEHGRPPRETPVAGSLGPPAASPVYAYEASATIREPSPAPTSPAPPDVRTSDGRSCLTKPSHAAEHLFEG